MKTIFVFILSVIAVQSAEQNEGLSYSDDVAEQRFIEMEQSFDRFSDIMKTKINDLTSLMSLKLNAQDIENKRSLNKLNDELRQKIENAQKNIFKKLDKNEIELNETKEKLYNKVHDHLQKAYDELGQKFEKTQERIFKTLNESRDVLSEQLGELYKDLQVSNENTFKIKEYVEQFSQASIINIRKCKQNQ